ncbi:beta-N-acetylhexosaminidase [Pedobacter sp.]|uniref:beta-N-acetylhexosaminidase n=1 Tax=Pedobacter sp. TaxID=1411316 RepID=UPI003BA9830D
MNKYLLLIATLVFPFLSFGQKYQVNVIPKPKQVEILAGEFKFQANTKIFYHQSTYGKAVFLANLLRNATGYKFPMVVTDKAQSGINLLILNDSALAKEDYHLEITTSQVKIIAADTAGIFNGIQTFRQLLPVSIEKKSKIGAQWSVPAMQISDGPRFAWRGYMQDVSRTFYSVQVMKKYLDVMALYKLNVLHLHLTDDQGWRIELKKHPELTTKKTTVFADKHEEPAERSGFYTQEQLRDLIQYAAARNITIVPEIDVPGHCWPIILTHPELGVNKKRTPEHVFPFLASWSYWGYQFTPNPLDPTKEEVYTFLDDVFTEVAALFPSTYIHFGGDEVVHRLWESEPHVQAFMKEKGFKKVNELQAYFVNRICKIIKEKGKKPIGWNDILDGGTALSRETAIMSWLGDEATKQAASQQFYTVATPTDYLYFDITQDDRNDGTMSDLAYGNINSLKRVYSLNPTAGLSPEEEKYVLGLQANQWTAIPQEVKDMNVQNFPRLLAVAEVGWTAQADRSFDDFNHRLDAHYPRLDALRIDYFTKGGYITGTWDPGKLENDAKTVEWDVTSKVYANGRVTAGFFYTKGKSFLKIKQVELLENGRVISVDNHEGLADTYRGTHKPKTYLYRMKVDHYKAKAKYTLRAIVSGTKGTDSYGNLTFSQSPYMPFVATQKIP